MERFQHKGALGGALGETDAETDGKEHKQSKVTSRSDHLGKNQNSPLFLSVFFLFVLRKCKYNVQRSHSTKQWRAGELKLLRRRRRRRRAVQRGGLRVRPLNHSQVFVVTQSGVSVQSSINRVEWCCESDFRLLRSWGWGGGVNLTRIQLSSVSTRHPLADINAHCNHRNYASPQVTGLHQMHSTIMHGCTSFPPKLAV